MIYFGKCICVAACLCGGTFTAKLLLEAFIYLETTPKVHLDPLQIL
uniref:Uncharacterized protein n=1 Tax=viral metagenome TaxID=1070528 RepID=A0A6C0JGK9_9ZZZZ